MSGVVDVNTKRPAATTWLQYARDLNVSNAEKSFAAIDDEIERLRKIAAERETRP